MDLELEGKRCVVLGGSRGIGRAIALGLAAEGADVAVCARGADVRGRNALHEVEGALQAHGRRVHVRPCDLGDAASMAAFLDGVRQAFGGVDVLVHNASALALGPSLADFEASLQLDVLAAARACSQVIPWMKAAGGGSIVLVASISGLEASPGPDFGYASAKAALIAYAKKLSIYHGPDRIRANAIAPGSVEFEGGLWDRVRRQDPPRYEAVRGTIPWGRMGTLQEIADVAVFLASPRSGWVTGACVPVDGGQHKGMR
ncbi:3-ketoacyl-ACP reductase [Pseudoxanthomonas jiangsuensis]|uniref:SDR family NAD(P)-dependent oxidoreductase n=1 Tax=Pseudoxanthomonas jiangsuensis TaxID=619688 RepID=UPI001391F7F5|nr:SDR family NAD(P)-dependent oxidoreductase [Pseudoxanthomonas jiangsuensis]KAF1696677.1 3-ketoacyl-ACP reductase [Pseudoxanthomonas jiangsuensis]